MTSRAPKHNVLWLSKRCYRSRRPAAVLNIPSLAYPACAATQKRTQGYRRPYSTLPSCGTNRLA